MKSSQVGALKQRLLYESLWGELENMAPARNVYCFQVSKEGTHVFLAVYLCKSLIMIAEIVFRKSHFKLISRLPANGTSTLLAKARN